MGVAEGEILRPLSASIHDDSDLWPEFALKNVTVVAQSSQTAVSLLSAHPGFRVRVEGELEEIDDERLKLGLYASGSASKPF